MEMETTALHARLMEDARRYDPAEHHRGLLAPFRDVILLWRVKFMSYEQTAAPLTRHGLRVSPAAVGVFCRRHLTKAEILRERERLADEPKKRPAASVPAPFSATPAPGKRGPKLARDDY
ncbi:MAG TPA: hypothetical protein PLG56_08605 [Lacunisphaera sp.]|nr:hypothetical protein [Lacunisphaera sp.]